MVWLLASVREVGSANEHDAQGQCVQDDVEAFAVCVGPGCADGIPKAFFLTLAFADNIRDVVGFFRLLRGCFCHDLFLHLVD